MLVRHKSSFINNLWITELKVLFEFSFGAGKTYNHIQSSRSDFIYATAGWVTSQRCWNFDKLLSIFSSKLTQITAHQCISTYFTLHLIFAKIRKLYLAKISLSILNYQTYFEICLLWFKHNVKSSKVDISKRRTNAQHSTCQIKSKERFKSGCGTKTCNILYSQSLLPQSNWSWDMIYWIMACTVAITSLTNY